MRTLSPQQQHAPTGWTQVGRVADRLPVAVEQYARPSVRIPAERPANPRNAGHGSLHLIRFGDVGWEIRCDRCRKWWPLDEAFWRPNSRAHKGLLLGQCRACHLAHRERSTEIKRARRRAYFAEYRATHREQENARLRAFRQRKAMQTREAGAA